MDRYSLGMLTIVSAQLRAEQHVRDDRKLDFKRVFSYWIYPPTPGGNWRIAMSPIEYIRAAYRLRNNLWFEIFTLIALGLILSYHAMTSPIFSWLLS